jgi:thiamine-monophosphate kinase
MSLGEFDLIRRYFKDINKTSKDCSVNVGIGDDAAILDVKTGYQLAVTTDTLVSGIHFFEDVCPYRLGYKSLAVNLSDLAAMGAEPKWVSLAITLPDVDKEWLKAFSQGFFDLAAKHNVSLVGGDTTKGPLSITVSAKGLVRHGKALLRSGAKPGDLVCVSGVLGDGGVGLDCKLKKLKLDKPRIFTDALELTEPRNHLGLLLSDYASSCIDISDGLIQDLQHIVDASSCSVEIDIEKLPLSIAMCHEVNCNTITHKQAVQYAVAGGDDYELLFTINADNYQQFCLKNHGESFTVIGQVLENDAEEAIKFTKAGQKINLQLSGWDHFKPN